MYEKYSVLMSVYYKENPDFLNASIESMLNQTVKPGEFVLVCDGLLTEDLDEVIEKYRAENGELMKIIRLERNGGLGRALNKGLEYCSYELVARMDSDDISRPDRCERQLKCFKAMNMDIVSGTVEEFEADIRKVTSRKLLPEDNDEIIKYSRCRNPFNHPCVMFRKSSVEAVHGYENYPYFEDYHLWVKLLRNGAIGYNIPEPLLYMRVGSGMYERRGGLYYTKCLVKFRLYLRKIHYISGWNFFMYTSARAVVSLIPSCLRKWIYLKLLRTSTDEINP